MMKKPSQYRNMQVHQGGQGFRNSSAQGITDDSKPSRLALVNFQFMMQIQKDICQLYLVMTSLLI